MWFRSKFSLVLLLFLLTAPTLRSQDWAQLNHYAEANRALTIEESRANRVVFMGNSITVGWLSHYPEFFENKSYINRGISGQTTPQMLVRFRQDVVELKPKVVVILAGTNDIAGNTGPSTLQMIMDNIVSMTEIAMANNIEVVLASVLPAYDYPWKPGCEPHIKIPKLNEMIRNYASDNDLIYLDYFSVMSDEKNGMIETYAYDGVHPNKSGYAIMAPMTEDSIQKALIK